ncbi:MAG: hypothetical protein U0Q15_05975 [Kineosporiaceae bacterium]
MRIAALTRTAVAGVLATAAIAAAGLTQAAAPAQAASTAGGAITRSEVLARARNWYDRRASFTYDSTLDRVRPYISDVDGGHSYGRDCSGFVSMAWHLSPGSVGGLNTRGLASSSISKPISKDQLLPGDILDYTAAHVILFEAWESDHRHFSYYSFGSTPVKHITHADILGARLDSHPTSSYGAYRYVNIRDDVAPTATTGTASAGWTVVDPRSGEQHAFWRTPDGHLGHWFSNPSTNGLQDLGGSVTGTPVAVISPDGEQHAFWRTPDGHLGHWYSNRYAHGIQDLGGNLAGDPTATVSPDGEQHAFWRTPDGHLGHWYSNPSAHGIQDLGGRLGGNPVAAMSPNGEQHAFWRTPEGHLGHWYFNRSANGIQDLGGALAGTPAVVIDPVGGQQHAFWRTPRAPRPLVLDHFRRRAAGPRWRPGRRPDGIDQPQWGAARLLAHGGGHLGHWYWNPSATAMQDLGGNLTRTPSAAMSPDGEQHAFWRTPEGHLGHWYVNPSAHGIQDLGGSLA